MTALMSSTYEIVYALSWAAWDIQGRLQHAHCM